LENIFIRDERKYLISSSKGAVLQALLNKHMEIDHSGEYLVQNIYFDNENWDVIRESMEKPFYKEKLRLRYYNQFNSASTGYLELKKKFDGIVYKRRIAFALNKIKTGSVCEIVLEDNSQISREIGYFIQNKSVSEKIHVAYKRIAFNGIEEKDFRVTFDRDVNFHIVRPDTAFSGRPCFNFHSDYSRQVLNQNQIIMEIKAAGAVPLWFSKTLSELKIFPASFSKVGICYALHSLKYYNPMEEKNAA